MGLDTRRPPLPAPTEDPSSMDNDTDLATDISRRTEKTSYSIPEDGSPVTIATSLPNGKSGLHGRNHSQTSLLIEYFEAGKDGEKSRSKPSVRVKVTPSAARRSKNGKEAVQITGIGKDRKPSYTRRISLGKGAGGVEKVVIDGTDISRSTDSKGSGHPPVEVEVLDPSDLSKNSRYIETTSNISSMPPESSLEPGTQTLEDQNGTINISRPLHKSRSRSLERLDTEFAKDATHLDLPPHARTRSVSRERITQRVMEKLAANPIESAGRKQRPVEYEPDTKPTRERRRRASRSHGVESTISPESSQLSSGITASQTSYRSGNSKVSLNNPRLLEMVEDTVRRLIPELHQLRSEQKTAKHSKMFDSQHRPHAVTRDLFDADLVHGISKSSSTPNIRSKRRTTSRSGNSYTEEHHSRSSRESTEPARRYRRSSRPDSSEDVDGERKKKSGHSKRDIAAATIAGGVLTAAALKNHRTRERLRDERSITHNERATYTDTSATPDEFASQDNSLTDVTERAVSRVDHDTNLRHTDREVSHDGPHRRIPFSGAPTESDITRASLMSASTVADSRFETKDLPIQQVYGHRLAEKASADHTAHTRTPDTARRMHVSSQGSLVPAEGDASPTSPRHTGLGGAAAGLAGLAAGRELGRRTRQYSPIASDRQSVMSPVSSVSSRRSDLHDPLIPQALHVSNNWTKAAESYPRPISPLSSPGQNGPGQSIDGDFPLRQSFAGRSKPVLSSSIEDLSVASNSQGVYYEPWLEEERLREKLPSGTLATTTRPRTGTHNAHDERNTSTSSQHDHINDVKDVPVNPYSVHQVLDIESNVASLVDPSTVESFPSSGLARDAVRDMDREQRNSPAQDLNLRAPDHGKSTLHSQGRPSPHVPSPLKYESSDSPLPHQNGPAAPPGDRSSRGSTPVKLGASGVPDLSNPMPEIGHGIDAESENEYRHSDSAPGLTTIDGERQHLEDPETPRYGRYFSFDQRDVQSASDHGQAGAQIPFATGAAALALGSSAGSKDEDAHRVGPEMVTISDEQAHEGSKLGHVLPSHPRNASITPVNTQAANDEGYVSGAYARSNETPNAKIHDEERYSQEDLANYEAAMQAGEDNDPFVTSAKRDTLLSGKSDGLGTPLYASATGRGMDRIHSQDILALMDHLTVRDAQRNARDTEILVTLIRSAAESRDSFEQMKKFIAEQDRMIMKNTDLNAAKTNQKILDGIRPQVTGPSRQQQYPYSDEASITSSKKSNVFKRALKGLGSRNANDLARVEEMLIQLLDDVEYLKNAQSSHRFQEEQATSPKDNQDDGHRSISDVTSSVENEVSSYEALRANIGSGYEPEGLAGTGFTPTHSANVIFSPTAKQTFHSGYDGRRDSLNRVSTVLEGDEDDYDRADSITPKPHRHTHAFADSPRGGMLIDSPSSKHDILREGLEYSADRQRKRGSFPRVSRWSKTTDSTVLDGLDSRRHSRDQRPLSDITGGSGAPGVRDTQYYDYDDCDEYGSEASSLGRSYTHKSHEQPKSQSPLIRSEADSTSEQTRSVSTQGRDPYSSDSPKSFVSATRRSYDAPAGPIPSSASASTPRPLSQPEEEKFDLPLDSDDDFDDPKYHAQRKSLLLHQPVAVSGKMANHQSKLESGAADYADDGSQLSGPLSDPSQSQLGSPNGSDLSQTTVDSEFDPNMWGSNPALSLARAQRLGIIDSAPVSQRMPQMASSRFKDSVSPASTPTDTSSPRSSGEHQDDFTALPIQRPRTRDARSSNGNGVTRSTFSDDAEDRRYIRSSAPPRTFDRLYYASPLGSGHLLEPIPEVRYSLETDRPPPSREMTPEPIVQPQPAISNASRLNPLRKISGPRPMVSKGSPKADQESPGPEWKGRNVIRRKVAKA